MIKGQIFEVEIIDINYMGNGVAKVDDFVIFIEGAVTGDRVQMKITNVKKNFAFGEILKILEKSKYRIEPPCKYYNQCGGCQLMHVDYKEQLKYKKNIVLNELKRALVNFDDAEINETIGMDGPIRYRNKTAFSVTKKNNEIIIGPYEEGTYNTVDISSCLLQSEASDKALSVLKNAMIKLSICGYDKKTRKGEVRNIVIRSNRKNELMLIIVTAQEALPNIEKLVNELTSNIKELKTIVQNINSKDTNLVMGSKNIILYGDGTINDTIGDFVFTISPGTFFQINSMQTEKLYEKAIEYADLDKNDICFDLYCGIGTISLMAANRAKKIYGVEIVEQSIINARENAQLNNVTNTEFYAGETEKILPMLYKKNIAADVIIVDPPRKGCEKEVIDTIIDLSPKKVVYVSCSPQSLARDIKLLESGGYKLKKIQPVDQFPWTLHVEAIILMTYCGSDKKK